MVFSKNLFKTSLKPTLLIAAMLSTLASAVISSAIAEPLAKVGKGEGKLDVIAWPGYLERGESDKNYDWVTGFEKETGCRRHAGIDDEPVQRQ